VWTQASTDDFDWSIQTGPTLTEDTGALQDHGLGKYLVYRRSRNRYKVGLNVLILIVR